MGQAWRALVKFFHDNVDPAYHCELHYGCYEFYGAALENSWYAAIDKIAGEMFRGCTYREIARRMSREQWYRIEKLSVELFSEQVKIIRLLYGDAYQWRPKDDYLPFEQRDKLKELADSLAETAT